MANLTLSDAIGAKNTIETFIKTMFQYYKNNKSIELGGVVGRVIDSETDITVTMSLGRTIQRYNFQKTLIEKAFSTYMYGGASIMEFNEMLDELFESCTKTSENAYKG
jgi:Leu/Phe-tRNA-protein transferase